jgi:hypothetical protein
MSDGRRIAILGAGRLGAVVRVAATERSRELAERVPPE